jgi:hypothetical protein
MMFFNIKHLDDSKVSIFMTDISRGSVGVAKNISWFLITHMLKGNTSALRQKQVINGLLCNLPCHIPGPKPFRSVEFLIWRGVGWQASASRDPTGLFQTPRTCPTHLISRSKERATKIREASPRDRKQAQRGNNKLATVRSSKTCLCDSNRLVTISHFFFLLCSDLTYASQVTYSFAL